MDDVEALGLNQQQLLAEITGLLNSTTEPSDANALLMNQEMQQRLLQVRVKILSMLQMVRARYSRNEDILKRRMQPRSQFGPHSLSVSGAILRKGTFHFKGNLYFRDVDGRSCPNNEDYEARCHTEMFPTDFDMRSRHVWTLLDKKNIIMGVKQQLLDHEAQKKNTLKRKRKPIDRHVKTLVSLMASSDSSFSIDWNQISTLDLEYRHSPFSCEAMWQVYLRPERRRDDWSPEEDETLLVVATTNQLSNWELIAASMDRRSDYQCFVRIHTALRHLLEPSVSVRWSDEDNERLRTTVERHSSNGIVNWKKVVEYFPGKSKSTLIGRYFYVLHPSISHEPFSAKEDMMLFAAVEEYNGKFHCFPRTLFPNRSLAQLRTRYHNVLAQRNKTDSWSVLDDTRLMEFVTEHGTSQWLNCATFLGNHSRTGCRTRFLVIKRFLEQNPSARVEDLPRRRSKKVSVITSENWAQRLQEWQEDPESLARTEQMQKTLKKTSRRSAKKPKIGEDVSKIGKLDKDYREFFKYSYNLQVKAPVIFPMPTDVGNLAHAARALAYNPPVRPDPLQTVSMPKELQKCYNTWMRDLPYEKKDAKSPLLPPNWSTMMGFRALCILSGDCRKQGRQAEKKSDLEVAPPAIQLFRQRLRALFYRTTLLSRLEPQLFAHLPTALENLSRPVPDYAEMGVILPSLDPEQESTGDLKTEPMSEDEMMGNVKQEVELEYILP
ncbi:hypothetical protein KR009_011188 [Drosophila setifemur]|nr:hypothetical protein KR009_011188 [Drosophila setifemur]